uniref:hypothetical protein n=1 Tax=Paractinoplanes polyasparticus TaxID=2856853 RepID=UPI001C856DD3|nr:hypothetical protein [Actinoplanes polyasparticus]
MSNDDFPKGPRSRSLASRGALAWGMAGLAVVGIGSYAVIDRSNGSDTVQTANGTSTPSASADVQEATADSLPTTSTSPPTRSPSPQTTAAPGPSAEPKSSAERVKAAKSFAAAHGVKNFNPVIPRDVPELSAAAAGAKVRSTGSVKAGRTMRIITAKGDLTGQRELGWVAGGIAKIGAVSCSQTFQLANEDKPAKKPTLLVCWRTSAAKSVATVSVNAKGRPSQSESVSVVNREWGKLG